jgi:hypothetical protein
MKGNSDYFCITEILDPQSLYNGYINLDDKYIITLFKKIILLKTRSLLETKQKNFLNWRIKALKIKSKAINLANEIKVSKAKDELLLIRSRRAKYYDSSEVKLDKVENLFYKNVKNNEYIYEKETIQNLKEQSRINSPDFCEFSENNANLPYYKIESKDISIHEKLYKEKFMKESRIKDFIKTRNIEDLKECTFQPKVNNNKAFRYHSKRLRNEKEPIYDQLTKVIYYI